MKKIIYALIAVTFVFTACRKDKIDAGGTATQNVAGEFWTNIDDDTESFIKISTFNTAANTASEMWLDDGGETAGYYNEVDDEDEPKFEIKDGFKGKIAVDVNAGTFSGANLKNEYGDDTFTVTNGKIVKDAVKAPGSGVTTDQITFDITFSSSPTKVYHFKGYRRTKFLSDDH